MIGLYLGPKLQGSSGHSDLVSYKAAEIGNRAVLCGALIRIEVSDGLCNCLPVKCISAHEAALFFCPLASGRIFRACCATPPVPPSCPIAVFSRSAGACGGPYRRRVRKQIGRGMSARRIGSACALWKDAGGDTADARRRCGTCLRPAVPALWRNPQGSDSRTAAQGSLCSSIAVVRDRRGIVRTVSLRRSFATAPCGSCGTSRSDECATATAAHR